jgi:uncharacterized tellurite resistance protein B-like protein
MAGAAVRKKFEALVTAAYIDGTLSDAERQVLHQKAAAMNLSRIDANDILTLGQQRKLTVTIPATAQEREALLEDLIEVVAADGRVEAPEYHLLARFAETLKISLPDLRQRVNRRMQKGHGETRQEPRRETVRNAPRAPQPPPSSPKVEAPRIEVPKVEIPKFEAPQFAASALPPISTPGPVFFESAMSKDPRVDDLPPVTLQLLKQSIMFDTEADSIAAISRTLSIPAEEAARIRGKILTAFPDLKPAQPLKAPSRK